MIKSSPQTNVSFGLIIYCSNNSIVLSQQKVFFSLAEVIHSCTCCGSFSFKSPLTIGRSTFKSGNIISLISSAKWSRNSSRIPQVALLPLVEFSGVITSNNEPFLKVNLDYVTKESVNLFLLNISIKSRLYLLLFLRRTPFRGTCPYSHQGQSLNLEEYYQVCHLSYEEVYILCLNN